MQTVEIFYSFQCPYSYLACERLSQIERKFDVTVLWQPYSLRAGGKNFQNGGIPSERASYIREDVARLSKAMELPLEIRENWPEEEFDCDRSVRGALVAMDMGLIFEYNVKMFHRWWGEGQDPNDQSFIAELCENLDIDPSDFAGKILSNDTRERARGVFKRAKKLQVFDTPTVVIGEERFFGIDRIQFVEEKLTSLGLGKVRI